MSEKENVKYMVYEKMECPRCCDRGYLDMRDYGGYCSGCENARFLLKEVDLKEALRDILHTTKYPRILTNSFNFGSM